ncbi:MAG: PTS sugar transporter subunit IIA [Acidobacteriota bacterium]
MKIQKLIEPEKIYLDLAARDVQSVLEAVANPLADDLGLDREEVVSLLLERERLGSTSVGDGFAIPHCKVGGLEEIVLALGRFSNAVPFGADDSDPVRFVFVVLSPNDQPAAHLQALSQIARVLKRKELRSGLMDAADAGEVIATIRRTAESEGL